MFIHHSVSGIQEAYKTNESVQAPPPSPFNFTKISKNTSFNFEHEPKVKVEPGSCLPEVKTQVDLHERHAQAAKTTDFSDSTPVKMSPVFQLLPKTPVKKDIWEALAERSRHANSQSASNETKIKIEVEASKASCEGAILTQSIHKPMSSMRNGHTTTSIRWDSTPSMNFGKYSNNLPSLTVSKPDTTQSKESKLQHAKLGYNESYDSIASRPSDMLHLTSVQRELNLIFPYLIHQRLENTPSQCIASLVGDHNVRCKNPAKVRLEKLTVAKFFRDVVGDNTIHNHVLELLQSDWYYCRRHLKVSNDRIGKILVGVMEGSSQAKEIMTAIDGWIQVLCGSRSAKPILGRINISPKVSQQIKQTTAKLVPWQPGWSQTLSVSKALEKVIKKPLTKSDQRTNKTGYIYIFWKAGQFGRVKIGRTKNLDVRLKGWQKCDPSHTYHKTTSEEGDPIMIPHVHRVEALIHIELKEFRRKQKCTVCKGAPEHDEWFEVDVEHAKRVLQKWQSWILQGPYAPDEDSEWTIHPEMEDTIQEVCKPIPIAKKISTRKLPPKIASPTKRKVSHRRRTV